MGAGWVPGWCWVGVCRVLGGCRVGAGLVLGWCCIRQEEQAGGRLVLCGCRVGAW